MSLDDTSNDIHSPGNRVKPVKTESDSDKLIPAQFYNLSGNYKSRE